MARSNAGTGDHPRSAGPDAEASGDGIRFLDGPPPPASPPAESLAGVRSLAEIEATGDMETRLIRLVSLFEVLVRGLVVPEAGPERKSPNRLLETLAYSGGHPRRTSFRAIEYALNCRNSLIHPNSGLRHAAPVEEREVRFACDVLGTAIREIAEHLPRETAQHVRGDQRADAQSHYP